MHLTKHHGLGNDFLVSLDAPIDAEVARAACDRRTGLGADGLIHLDRASRRFTLRNADGSLAEVSGNGLRCLGQALALDRGVDELAETVQTPAGPRRLAVRPGGAPHTALVDVDMGDVEVIELGEGRARLSLGNPHLVLAVPDVAEVDPAVEGPRHGGDVNVELISPAEAVDTAASGRAIDTAASGRAIDMVVWERGVGVTQACGSGACAAAFAARAWGMAGSQVEVRMPGGSAGVRLDGAHAVLSGPAVLVAKIEYMRG